MSEAKNKKTNLLAAFPYIRDDLICSINSEKESLNFLIDSGAFTAWKNGTQINLDDYCRLLDKLPFEPFGYFMLDAIGDPKRTMQNYEIMLKRGYKPIPIFTRGEDSSVLDDYYKTSEIVGIGGLVGTPGNKGFVKGIMKMIGKRKCHWLGFTSISFISAFRPYSCDSSSWVTGERFGAINLFTPSGNQIQLTHKKFLKSHQEKSIKMILQLYDEDSGAGLISDEWRNTGIYQTFLQRLGFKSQVMIQQVIRKKLGTEVFAAISGSTHLKSFILAAESLRCRGSI